jgi:hypothetical protein
MSFEYNLINFICFYFRVKAIILSRIGCYTFLGILNCSYSRISAPHQPSIKCIILFDFIIIMIRYIINMLLIPEDESSSIILSFSSHFKFFIVCLRLCCFSSLSLETYHVCFYKDCKVSLAQNHILA